MVRPQQFPVMNVEVQKLYFKKVAGLVSPVVIVNVVKQ